MTTIAFSLPALNQSYTLDICGSLLASAPEAMTDVSAVATYHIKKSVLRSVFKFHSDSADVNDLDVSDTKYYVFMNNWPVDASLNPAHAVMTTNPMLATGGDVLANKNLVKHDFVRYLAYKLFNTVYGVDLFSNENELINDISSKGRTKKGDIFTALNNVSTTSTVTGTHALSLDPSNNKYTTNDASLNTNICRELIRQIGANAPGRFHYGVSDASGVDLSGNIGVYREVPFENGDSINFKLTITPHSTQNNLTGVAGPLDSRVYKIRLLVSDTANTTPVDGTATDLLDYIPNL
jgi:hypothetical protein